MSAWLIVFGAALKPDGSPTGVMRRRIEGAAAIYRGLGEAWVIASGGVARAGITEAEVIRDGLVAAGVPADRIVVEDQARDTLDAVRRADAILRGRSEVNMVVPVTSGFHQPRCRLLLRMRGWRVRLFRMPPDRPHAHPARWALYLLKEAVSLPYDAALSLLRR